MRTICSRSGGKALTGMPEDVPRMEITRGDSGLFGLLRHYCA